MLEQQRCATCRHWQPPGNAPHDDGFGTCAAINHSGPLDPCPREPAYVTDAEGYASWLKTRPDFGCVLHAAKEPA